MTVPEPQQPQQSRQPAPPEDLRAVLARATTQLATAGVASPRHDAEVLAAHVLGCPRGALLVRPAMTAPERARHDELVARRAARVPLQHLTGEAFFRHVVLAVGPGVFVPRPETEVMVGWAVERLLALVADGSTAATSTPVVVDLCTGSGAAALAIADEVPAALVHAVELDESAHAWATRNLEASGVRLVQGDMADAFHELDGAVDVVVANPPYIPHEAWESVEPEVRDHDPALALWADDEGLAAIRVVERTAARLLRPGGLVAVEHADVQGEQAQHVLASTGAWVEVRDHPDLAGRSRFVTARRS